MTKTFFCSSKSSEGCSNSKDLIGKDYSIISERQKKLSGMLSNFFQPIIYQEIVNYEVLLAVNELQKEEEPEETGYFCKIL